MKRIIGIIVSAVGVISSAGLAQESVDPVKVSFWSIAKAIDEVRSLDELTPIEFVAESKGRIPIRPLQLEAAADLEFESRLRKKFASIQKFLFKDRQPFQLVLCERCDYHAQFVSEMVVYLDFSFMKKLILEVDESLVDLAMAHHLSHYVLEKYCVLQFKTPAGHTSAFFDPAWLRGKDEPALTLWDRMLIDARYHGEVEAFAAATLILMGQSVPDFSVIVKMYRENRRKLNRRHPETPEHIYLDQEVRVSTLNWVKAAWPLELFRGLLFTRE